MTDAIGVDRHSDIDKFEFESPDDPGPSVRLVQSHPRKYSVLLLNVSFNRTSVPKKICLALSLVIVSSSP